MLLNRFESKNELITVVASMACMAHCLLLPLLVVILPSVSRMFHNPILEWSLLLTSITCGDIIIKRGYCQHKKAHSLYIFGFGTALWLLHTLMHDASWILSTSMLGIGAVFVGISYFVNHKLLHCCQGHH